MKKEPPTNNYLYLQTKADNVYSEYQDLKIESDRLKKLADEKYREWDRLKDIARDKHTEYQIEVDKYIENEERTTNK